MSEVLYAAHFETPIGTCRAASTQRGLAYLELPHAAGRGLAGYLHHQLSGAAVVEGFAPNRAAMRQIVDYLEGKRRAFDLALDLRGTPFQNAVWQALLAIPHGETRSYAEIAAAVGRPLALRVVGNASAANPVPLVVPCHRVVASDGKLGGYTGGGTLKARLLAMERDALAGPMRVGRGALL